MTTRRSRLSRLKNDRSPERGLLSMDFAFVGRAVRWLLVLTPLLWLELGMDALVTTPNASLDSLAYWLAGASVARGGTPYTALPPAGPHVIIGPLYVYPPPFAALLSLLPLTATALHGALVLVNLAGVTMLSCAAARLAGWRTWGALGIATLLYVSPYRVAVAAGSIHVLLLGACAMAIAYAGRLSGAVLASAASVTVHPAWAFGCTLRAAETRRASLVAIAVTTAGTYAILGRRIFSETVLWSTVVAPTLAQGMFSHPTAIVQQNWSPSFLPVAAALGSWPIGVPLPWPARAWLSAVQLAVPLWVIWRTRHSPWNVQAGWALIAAVLAAPIVRPAYLAVLVLVAGLLRPTRL